MSSKEKLSFSQNYYNCINNPKKLVRYGVLFICSIVVVFQLSECFTKLFHPPITTHSHFDLNDTISYPALTFCRDPPYKKEVLAKYNLSYHPKYTSSWRDFNFEEANLDEVFNQSTYGRDEFFIQYGLDGNRNDVEIQSGIFFNMGQCHTLLPMVSTRGSWKTHGYSLILQHDISSIEESLTDQIPGWHLFIHETKENFTEINAQTSGRVEYMYITVGEEVEIKMTAQHFDMLSSTKNTCTDDINHSAIHCADICQWTKITEPIGCTGPWMPGIDLPYCNNYTQMRTLISQYQTLTDINISDCDCDDPCSSIIYSAYVMNRGEFRDQPTPSSQVWVYYTSKMVAIFAERHGYDLPQFVADMGGSLGFLLGLSVLGLIRILEKLTMLVFGGFIDKQKNEIDDENDLSVKNHTNRDDSDFSSSTTLELPLPEQKKNII